MLRFFLAIKLLVLTVTPLAAFAQQVPPPPPPALPPPPPPPPVQMPETVSNACFTDGVNCMTLDRYTWIVGTTDLAIRAPSGFVTDFASVPAWARMLFANQGTYSRAAVIHDLLYWSQTCTRIQADNLFYIAMRESGVSWTSRKAIHAAVRLGGGSAWSRNTADRNNGLGRVVPDGYRTLANDHSWSMARVKLKQEGVVDPPLVVDPNVCKLGDATIVP